VSATTGSEEAGLGSVLRVLDLASDAGRSALAQLCSRGAGEVDQGAEADVVEHARTIVAGVRRGGDRALLDFVRRYDRVDVASVGELRVTPARAELLELPGPFSEALERAIAAVERYHAAQADHAPAGFRLEHEGLVLEERRVTLRRVGLYVPGGRFPYPSSAIMSVLPARRAGVEEIVVMTPRGAWDASAPLRATLARLEVDEVWTIGGAHAIAALAYGTETIRPVQLIAGPGNRWVAAAKQLVAGQVGVDREAGPSEVVIVADGTAPALHIALDLLAQAEHDPRAIAVLVTPSALLASAVAARVSKELESLPTASTARAALESLGCALVVADLEQALAVAEQIAPEHLQLMGRGAEELAARVRCAGAVFVGCSTPTVLGDYVAGPSHVLPTGGTARFASGLSVEDFTRRCHVVRARSEAVRPWAEAAAAFAEVEGLAAHGRSAALRAAAPDGDEP
jgi:histidinol dehydrogenase